MECIKCYYESMILEQQISYAVLESEYNSLCGNEVVTEGELSSKVGEKFKFVLSTIGRWITNIINFVTKTIPAFIKGVVQKISDKINKREKNKKVVDATALPKTKQDEVKSIAASINNNNKLGRKIENHINTSEIKKELDNATKTDSSASSTVVDDKEENLKKATEQYNENKKKIDEKISKVEDAAVKAELAEANDKKEEVVVKVDKEPKLVGYKGMYIKYPEQQKLYYAILRCETEFNQLRKQIDRKKDAFFDKYPDESPEEIEDRKEICRKGMNSIISKGNPVTADKINDALDELKSIINSTNIAEIIVRSLITLPEDMEYFEKGIGRLKEIEKFVSSMKKNIDTASKKQKISNEDALLLTKYFNIIMPTVNRYVREMTYAYTFFVKTVTSFCDNAVAVYE